MVAPASPPTSSLSKPLSVPQKAMRKMGLVRDIDLALHIPLRYEDETRIVKLADAQEGDTIQIEATVVSSEVQLRPRRQLLVIVDDGTGTCVLRFFSAYPAQQKALAVGQVIRARGEVRGGFLGLTMMHPALKAATGDLPSVLTPVYPTSAGLPQTYLRRAIAGALSRADLSESLPSSMTWPSAPQGTLASSLRQALTYLHHPTPDVSIAALEDRSHPAWQRLKAEELLAQQLSQRMAKLERDTLKAPALKSKAGGWHDKLKEILPFQLTAAQQRVGLEIAQDLARSVPCTACFRAT